MQKTASLKPQSQMPKSIQLQTPEAQRSKPQAARQRSASAQSTPSASSNNANAVNQSGQNLCDIVAESATILSVMKIFNQKVDNPINRRILNQMVEQLADQSGQDSSAKNTPMETMSEAQVSAVLKAVSDPTRRSLLTTLVQQGPSRVTDLAGHYSMSLNAVSKHIKVLEKAGLVARRTHGREHLIEAEMQPLDTIEAWFNSLRSIWELRLEKLDELLTGKDSSGTSTKDRDET